MTHGEYRRLALTDKEKAQRKLFDEYLNYVYAIVFSRLRSAGSREDVDECVGDVFADVFSSYDAEAPLEGDVKGFVGVVAYRKATAYFNKLAGKGAFYSLDDETAETLPSDEDVAEKAELDDTRRTLLELIDKLGSPDSEIIVQKYFFNRTSREIAEIVSMSPVMVRVRCGRALKKLRKKLADKDISI